MALPHQQHIAELGPVLSRLGIRRVVISPGSRNAPLIQLFTSSGAFRCHSIVDERSAAYVALGMARETGETVVLLSTSGTAVLNMAPAVAEAFYQEIPLLVISADRPLEPIPAFNNQWMDQQAPYFNWSRGFLNLPSQIRDEEELPAFARQVRDLVGAARFPIPGPVHINILLEEPLYEDLPGPMLREDQWYTDGAVHEEAEELPLPGGRKTLILAGMDKPDEELEQSLRILGQKAGTVIIAENISNKAGDFIAHPELCLAFLPEDEKEALMPELVLHYGGQVVSKRLKLFLQGSGIPEYRRCSRSSMLDLARACAEQESPQDSAADAFAEAWNAAQFRALDIARERLEKLPFSNFLAVYRALEALSPGTVVHLGNSSVIRYAQLMPMREDLSYFANRGTSGIDGCVSSAVGAAMVSEHPHFLIVGDLSFVYDSNGLWNKDFPANLRILLVNDRGGGIFRLLDGPGRMNFFEEFSVTRHPVSPGKLSAAFGRKHLVIHDSTALVAGLDELLDSSGALQVLEADTSESENSRIFKAYFD